MRTTRSALLAIAALVTGACSADTTTAPGPDVGSLAGPTAAIAPNLSSAPVLYDHTQSDGTLFSQTLGLGNAYYADDFVVPAGGWTVAQVMLTGRLNAPALAVSIVPDDNGMPSALPNDLLVPVSKPSPCCDPALSIGDHLFTLPAAVQLAPGTYWVVVRVTADAEKAFEAYAGSNAAGSSIRSKVDGLPGWGYVDMQGRDMGFALFAPAPAAGPQYTFAGFAAPVDNDKMNMAKAGQAIPLRWRLTDATGAPVTTLTTATVTVASLACDVAGGADQVEEYAAGGSGLQNLGNGYYQLNWKTPASYAKSCKTLKLDLGEASGPHTAAFQFTK
jgi:hypothetical protein